MDLADLAEERLPPNFTITSEHLGELGFRALYGIDYPYLMATGTQESDEDFIKKLMVALGWRTEGRKKLTEKDQEDLTRSDAEAFCQALIEHEPAVFDGATRGSGEDLLLFTRKASADAVEAHRGPFKKSATLDAARGISRTLKMLGLKPSAMELDRNKSAVANIRSLIEARPTYPRLPELPPNPALKTNAILNQVHADISRMVDLSEATAEMQTTLNNYARSAIAEMKAGSELTERNSKRALRVALAGVAVGAMGALAAAGTWLWTADQQVGAEVQRRADAEAAAAERQADRELFQQQLQAMRANTSLLDKRLPLPAPRPAEEASAAP